MRKSHKSLVEKSLNGRDFTGDADPDEIILKHILKKSVRLWTGFRWFRIVSSDTFL